MTDPAPDLIFISVPVSMPPDAASPDLLPGCTQVLASCGHLVWSTPVSRARMAVPGKQSLMICTLCAGRVMARRAAAGLPVTRPRLLAEQVGEVQAHLGVAATDQLLARARAMGITVDEDL